MTTIKSIIGWLFGALRGSWILLDLLVIFIVFHIGVAVLVYIFWLAKFLARVTA